MKRAFSGLSSRWTRPSTIRFPTCAGAGAFSQLLSLSAVSHWGSCSCLPPAGTGRARPCPWRGCRPRPPATPPEDRSHRRHVRAHPNDLLLETFVLISGAGSQHRSRVDDTRHHPEGHVGHERSERGHPTEPDHRHAGAIDLPGPDWGVHHREHHGHGQPGCPLREWSRSADPIPPPGRPTRCRSSAGSRRARVRIQRRASCAR